MHWQNGKEVGVKPGDVRGGSKVTVTLDTAYRCAIVAFGQVSESSVNKQSKLTLVISAIP